MDFSLSYRLAPWEVRQIFIRTLYIVQKTQFNPLILRICRGLAIVFAEDTAGTVNGPESVKPNDDWKQLCPIWDSFHNPDL